MNMGLRRTFYVKWMYGKMDEKLFGGVVERMCVWMDGQMKGCVVGKTDGPKDGCECKMDGQDGGLMCEPWS